MLELNKISKVYESGSVNESAIFNDFNLQVKDGEFVTVVGSNGSGKTTLLNLICGSIPLDQGEIILNDQNLTKMPEYKRSRRIGRVFQDPAKGTCPHLSIMENMSIADNKTKRFNLERGVDLRRKSYYRERLAELGMGLEDHMEQTCGTLSGGQRQALALLMSTLTPLELLILDEHTAALDPKSSEIVMELTNKIVQQSKVTTLMVTHNLRFALEYGDRMLMMHEGAALMDESGASKEALVMDDLLNAFYSISIEYGN
ncbi:MAG: ABC transporter ATP-binding protein [Fastidiosipilaceae bacterium]|jgi:putative ABC transport system ATP-binding protein